ncbi:SPARC-related modular calcium-binding protein 1 [Collichthys lucidus]|uniref:SPARC-related modular calcium-binding protein 1 n=1 Tax=Collichthys lucidus TaxID=240159 RepID=A0A4U5VFY6_COLLU|nr:SPARC-related modular calcium-binding protein 1 [Collichthys lucidus]
MEHHIVAASSDTTDTDGAFRSLSGMLPTTKAGLGGSSRELILDQLKVGVDFNAIPCCSLWLIGDRDSHCGVICSRTQGKPVCGSDGRSYETGCELQRARCQDKTLTLAHRGRCRGKNWVKIDQLPVAPAPTSTSEGRDLELKDAGQSKCRVERTQALEQARRPQESMFIPDCNEDGTFAQVQCHTLTGYCWCVTSDGKPVSGSSVQNRTPVCSDDGSKPTPTMETHVPPEGDEKVPSCDQERQSALEEARQNPREAIFIPDCGPGGLYKPVQCHQSTGYCWCVLVDTGRPIPGTSTRYQTPECDSAARSRVSDTEDPFQGRDLTGCPEGKKVEFITSLLDALTTDMVQAINSPAPSGGGRFVEPDPSHTLEERVVHWYFAQLDNNGSHDINKKELKPFKRYLKKKAKPKKCARKFTDYCDLNKDRAISLQELKGCLGVSKEAQRQVAAKGQGKGQNCSSHLTATLLTSILAAVLGSLQIGYHTGNVNAPAKIIEEFFNHTWKARHNQSMPDHSLTLLWSLSVSIKDFGALLGSLGVKYLADSYGRRNSILIVNCLSVVGACLMAASKTSKSFEVLILGRLVFGLFCGLVMSLNPLYIQEVSPTNLRGAFATLNQVSFATGILVGMVAGLETALGTEHHWAMMLSLSLIPALTQYLVLPFCPESPRYLLINRREESRAEAALLRLRGSADKVFTELEEMKEEAARTQSGVTIHEFFKKRRYKQPIIIVLIINLGSQLSGFNAIINYSTRMFQAKFDEAKYLTLGVGAVNVTFTLVAHLVPELRSLQVLLVFCLISAYELGPGPISWFIAAELFDQPGRPIAMAFTSMLNWGGKFVLALLFPPLLKVCGAYVYLLFMIVALVAFTFTWIRLPETKGRTFDDIAELFRGADEIPLHNKMGFNTFT